MAKTKFPKVLHVVQEVPRNDDPFLVVQEDGVRGIEQEQDVAVYRLVKVGRVTIEKTFVEKKKK